MIGKLTEPVANFVLGGLTNVKSKVGPKTSYEWEWNGTPGTPISGWKYMGLPGVNKTPTETVNFHPMLFLGYGAHLSRKQKKNFYDME